MKKILFVYSEMMVGGSTTSLLSLLNELDYSKYNVDLLLYKNQGELLHLLPSKVNLLEQAYVPQSKAKKIVRSIFDGTLLRAYIDGLKYTKKIVRLEQSMAYCQMGYCRKVKQEYDVVIGYMELWSDVFANLKIKAKKRISWIHTDYQKANLYPQIDHFALSRSNYIINVSRECCQSFQEIFPSLSEKVVFVPNILSEAIVLRRSIEYTPHLSIDATALNLLTVCRLDNTSKAIDRGLNVIQRLVADGFNLKWYIIGDGVDRKKIEEQILQFGLTDNVILLGLKTNPYPYFKLFDAFMLISKFEGKPMSVTEAQILGLPAVVTNYNSANEQVEFGFDGIICENNENSIYEMLRDLLTNRDKLKTMRENLKLKRYGNEKDIEIVHKLIDD